MRGCTEHSSERLTTRKYRQSFALGLWQGMLPAPTQLEYRYVAVEGKACPWTWEGADEGGLRHPRRALCPLCKTEAGDVTHCMARCKKVEQARKLAVLELDELLVSTGVRVASTGRDRVVPCPEKETLVTGDAMMRLCHSCDGNALIQTVGPGQPASAPGPATGQLGGWLAFSKALSLVGNIVC